MRQMALIPGQFWSRRRGQLRAHVDAPCLDATVALLDGLGALQIGWITPLGGLARNGGDHVLRGKRHRRRVRSRLQLGLVGLDEQEVVAAPFSDRLDDRPEGEGGIAGDDRAVERQLLQKLDGVAPGIQSRTFAAYLAPVVAKGAVLQRRT